MGGRYMITILMRRAKSLKSEVYTAMDINVLLLKLWNMRYFRLNLYFK